MLEKPHVDEAFFLIFLQYVRSMQVINYIRGGLDGFIFWIRKIRFLHTRYAIVM